MADGETAPKPQLHLISGSNDTHRSHPAKGHTERLAHLRPVTTFLAHRDARPISIPEPYEQGLLFPDESLLGVVDMSGARASAFAALLQRARPKWLMDLRTVPRFDYDTMNRQRFFQLFERRHIIYRDVAGLAGISSQRDASLSSGHLATIINDLLDDHPQQGAPGPIMCLLENAERTAVAQQILPLLVEPMPPGGWKVRNYLAR